MTDDDDEEYEAELQARTPEQWQAMHEEAVNAVRDIHALQHLWLRRDVKDWNRLGELVSRPDKTLGDIDYEMHFACELADRLREARDKLEVRERQRWHDPMFCAAMIGSSSTKDGKRWLRTAADDFLPATLSHATPPEDAPLLELAAHAVETLLHALTMSEEHRAKVERHMDRAFVGMMEDMGVEALHGSVINGQFVPSPKGEVIPFPPRQPELPFPASTN